VSRSAYGKRDATRSLTVQYLAGWYCRNFSSTTTGTAL
jgi:hypothetical protein